MGQPRSHRYAAWVDHHRVGLLVLSVLIALLGGFLASRLPLRSDLSSLLPASRKSVHDLKALQQRARAFGRVFVTIEADDPAMRARAADRVLAGLQGLDKSLVGHVESDDSAASQFIWRNRFLWAELDDLIAARDALVDRIRRAKLAANPLYLEIDDSRIIDEKSDRLTLLRTKLADAEQRATRPAPTVSTDKRVQLIAVYEASVESDQARAKALIGSIQRIFDDVRSTTPGAHAVKFGMTGGVTMSRAEHRSVVEGMVMAGLITMLLVGLAMFLYFRSGRLVIATLWSLVVGVLATLGVTWLAIGYLNVMSAFLTAIVVGNGINAGLILVSRYMEEVGAGREPVNALGPAISGALPGTLAAMLTATAAYMSLVVSDFRGFRQFGIIAGVGMVLTWISAFTILPALLAVLARRREIRRVTRTQFVGNLLARIMPEGKKALALAAAVTVGGVVITVSYLTNNPFTTDWRDLQSSNREIRRLRAADKKLADTIPSSARFSGQSYQLVIGVDRRDQASAVVEELRALDGDRPANQRLFLDVRSIDDLLPPQQDEKLAVLAELRTLIDNEPLDSLIPEERDTIAKLRPPNDLRRLTDADIPSEIAWPFIEQDGTRGRLVALRGAVRFKTWNVQDREYFAAGIKALTLPPGAVIGGEALVIADIVQTMEHDAPIMILVALFGSLLAVLLVLGVGRHAMVTVLCGFSGVAVMIAGCALFGLRVNFLDLTALPITIGIGIDYAVNLAARDRQPGTTRQNLGATGAAVLLCSYTTSVGYGSLLLSANGGIRAFALAAIIGEISCIFTALILAPALLARLHERGDRRTAASVG